MLHRRPTTQDISWFLDVNERGQLDIDPPYQRRSVWTRKDRRFFLDTIFRGFPSPAIFLHKQISNDGQTTYHVVDGKQRLETILMFAGDKLSVAKDFGDVRLDGKKWSALGGEPSLRQAFWNYQLPVEQIDNIEGLVINQVFDRLNRNSRRLNPQEIRHARFEGWLMQTAQSLAEGDVWEQLGVSTRARAKRMLDVQIISELAILVLLKKQSGFDQDAIDEMYAAYDDPADPEQPLDTEEFQQAFSKAEKYLLEMNQADGSVAAHARSTGHLYTLWALIVLEAARLPAADHLAPKYAAFMSQVEMINQHKENLKEFLESPASHGLEQHVKYWSNTRGASTELPQRHARLEALATVMLA